MRNVYIDFDNTLSHTIEAVCNLYNTDYKYHKDFEPAKWYEVYQWDFSDQCPLMTKSKLYSYFEDIRLFEVMEFMDNAREVIERLSAKYKIVIATKGTDKNFELKQKWLHNNLDCNFEFIGVPTYIKYKTNIDMTNGIFIDDRVDNLEHSNAEFKIAFGDIYEWNCRWDGHRCFNWYDVERMIG